MGLGILGVIKRSIFYLPNYSLSFQLVIINLGIIISGLIFLTLFNYFLISTNKFFENRNKNILNNLNNISKYLENTSILRVPIFQYDYRCRYIEDIKTYKENCDTQSNINPIELSEPELEKYSTEQFIFQNYGDKDFKIRIFNDNLIKIADSSNLFSNTDVEEINLSEKKQENYNVLKTFTQFYIRNFNNIYIKYLENKYLNNLDKNVNEITLIIDTIKNRKIIQKTYLDSDNDAIRVLLSPIIQDQKVYGVTVITYQIFTNNISLAQQSQNLFYFFLLFIFVTVFLSFIFLRGLITPLKQLTDITILERDKTMNLSNLEYPDREDEIGILSKQIQIMSQDLNSQINQLEKFTSDVAHELKNPLTAINSSSELLENKAVTEENRLTILRNFRKDVQRMNRLISDISNFSKTIAEIESENFVLIDINNFLEDFIKKYNTNNKNIKIIFNNNNEKNIVSVNEDKLLQVILNLVDNSTSIADINSSILLTSKKIKSHFLEIKIYDQGIGINFEDKDKIFERFYSDRNKNRDKHSGLGLSISREIIKSFGGTIELTKSDNLEFSGACFIINLPLRKD